MYYWNPWPPKHVILELITTKCMPTLSYGLQLCQLSDGDLHSLDFTYNRMCMKLFQSLNIDLVKEWSSLCAA